jgi:cyclophilin family peptidyl-prolyl cis-trans isomerase
VAAAGVDQSVSGGSTVTLDGSGSAGLGLRYSWREISGPSVSLSATDAPRTTFSVPQYEPNGTNTLEFELTVTDGSNRAVTDRVRVTVRNPSGGSATGPRVRVATTMGDFVIEVNPDKAPLTVKNFLAYVDQGFYAGTLIHRVMPGFVIQGGGYLPGLTEKTPGNPIFNESDNGLKNVRGSVAMARTGDDPNSARSQFFVNLADNAFLDYKPGEPGYAVFGQVVEGMDVVDQIAGVGLKLNPNDSSGQEVSLPVKDIVIQSITRVE